MPEGLAGLVQKCSQLRQRIGWVRLMPVVLASLAAAALLAAGTAFTVELLQRLYSQDYRALAAANAANAWPPVTLFGRAWSPAAPATWLVPALLFGLGGALIAGLRRHLAGLPARPASGPSPATPLADPSRSAA
jgi:branched-chain amino acid transport system permease protein